MQTLEWVSYYAAWIGIVWLLSAVMMHAVSDVTELISHHEQVIRIENEFLHCRALTIFKHAKITNSVFCFPFTHPNGAS